MNERFVRFVLATNLLLTVTREAFDLLARLWLPILWNFANLLAVIVALFGVAQGRRTLSIVYCCWAPMWTCWNLLVLCFYLNVHGWQDDERLLASLNFGTAGRSWWYDHVPFCPPVASDPNSSLSDRMAPSECLIDYKVVEMAVSLVHIFCSCMCLVVLFFHIVDGRSCAKKSQHVVSEQRRHRPTVTVEFSAERSRNPSKSGSRNAAQKNSTICASCLPDSKSCGEESVGSSSFQQNSRYIIPNYKRPSGSGRQFNKPAADRIRSNALGNVCSGSYNSDSIFHNLAFSDTSDHSVAKLEPTGGANSGLGPPNNVDDVMQRQSPLVVGALRTYSATETARQSPWQLPTPTASAMVDSGDREEHGQRHVAHSRFHFTNPCFVSGSIPSLPASVRPAAVTSVVSSNNNTSVPLLTFAELTSGNGPVPSSPVLWQVVDKKRPAIGVSGDSMAAMLMRRGRSELVAPTCLPTMSSDGIIV